MVAENLFDDVPALAVPRYADEYGRKMPGAQDAQGDHCGGPGC